MEKAKRMLIQEIMQTTARKQDERKRERELKDKEKKDLTLFSFPTFKKSRLQEALGSILPPRLVPSNVGFLTEITWTKIFMLEFDFSTGVNTVEIVSESKDSALLQNVQEGNFILKRIYFDYDDASALNAPLGLILRDNQSSRQFNDRPIPLQMIGDKSNPFCFDLGFLVTRSSRMTGELVSFLEGNEKVTFTGTGKIRLIIEGELCRQEKSDLFKRMLSM